MGAYPPPAPFWLLNTPPGMAISQPLTQPAVVGHCMRRALIEQPAVATATSSRMALIGRHASFGAPHRQLAHGHKGTAEIAAGMKQ